MRIKTSFVLLFLGATLLSFPAWLQAMPARPGLRIADPTHAVPGLEVPNMRQVGVRLVPGGGRIAFGTLTVGMMRYPVLLIGYTDVPETFPDTLFQDELFSSGTYPTGSLHDYFAEVSYGQLDIEGSCDGWYQATNNRAYYGHGEYGINPASYPNNAAKLVQEAIAAAEVGGFNFAPYDNDSDGFVDNLIVIHSGEGAEGSGDPNDIWSHSGSLTGSWGRPAYVTNDGVTIDAYTMQPERSSIDTSRMIEIGVICHELGHALGLPDLYDTTPYPTYDSYGVGNYCLMGSGSWGANGYTPERPVHLCPWAKKFLGWLNPILLTSDVSGQMVQGVETHPEAYRVGAKSPTDTLEYFLAENRRQTGFDINFPTSGLLIWHIDETIIADSMPNNHVNADKNHKGVDLEEADGLNDLDAKRNAGDAGDFYPGSTSNRMFTPSSNPNSNSDYIGSTGVTISGISDAGDTMTFDLTRVGIATEGMGTLTRDAYGLLRSYPNPFGPQTAISFSLSETIPGSERVSLRIYDLSGRLIRTLVSGQLGAGVHQVVWEGEDSQGNSLPAGVYFYTLKVGNEELTRRMVLVR